MIPISPFPPLLTLQDSVRVLAVPAGISLAQTLTPEEVKASVLNTLKLLMNDKSWRVRYMVADNFVEVRSPPFFHPFISLNMVG